MVAFFSTTLLFSCISIVVLIAIKRWEVASGHLLGSSFRPRTHQFFQTIVLWVENILPTLVQVYIKRSWSITLRCIHKVVALAVLYTEYGLEKALHVLRHSTDVRRGVGEKPSLFLREVSEHKRKFLRTQKLPPTAPSSFHKE